MFNLFTFLILVLSITFAADAKPELFPTGKATRLPIGYGNLDGTIEVRRGSGNSFVLKTKVYFYGASIFSKTNHQAIEATDAYVANRWQIPAEVYSTSADSFNELPAIKERLQKILNEIERLFANDFLKLQLEAVFPSDKALLGKTSSEFRRETSAVVAGVMLKDALKIKTGKTPLKDGVPVVISPMLERGPGFVTPNIWAPYTPARLLAHEFAHEYRANKAVFFMGWPL